MDPLERLRSCTGFQWDNGDADKNWELHRVSRGECEQVFFNQPLQAMHDPAHSSDEERFLALGQTDQGRLLFVVFTIRDSLIRVISARDMSAKERKAFQSS